jgi:uncharacterized protein with NRDE domain
MCLIVLAVRTREDVPFVLAANRDEAHARPTAAADWWPEHPDIFGGRDLEKGGSWLAMTKSGRIAAVTNHRRVPLESRGPSRGWLVRDFVLGDETARDYVERRKHDGFHSFNLIVWDGHEAWALGDDGVSKNLGPGVHGLSNARVDDPWPKVTRTTAALEHALAGPPDHMVGALFEALADRNGAPDADLPSTGVGLQLERVLAPPFIVSPVYGTRSTSVVVTRATEITFEERSFDSSGARTDVRAIRLQR